MAQRIIGLDIGSWSIKAMVMESSLRRVNLVELREHHIPADAFGQPLADGLGAAIRAVLSGVDADVIVAGIPGVQVLTRELALPFSDEKRVGPILGFQLESLLPRPLETMVYDWHVLRKTAEGASLLCPAADKVWLEDWLTQVRTGGADPRQLTLGSIAIENLVPHLDMGVEEGGVERVVAVIDLGHRSSEVTLLRGGKLEGIRALSRGGHQVTQALARQLQIAYADAEHLKHEGLRLDGEVPDGVDELEHRRHVKIAVSALEPILRELKMTLDAMVSRLGVGVRLNGVVLTGGMSRLAGIDDIIARMLDVPVVRGRMKGPIWEAIAGQGAVCEIGLVASALALEYVADGEHRVNLRRDGDGGMGSDFGALRAKAGWIGAFLAILLAIFMARKVMRVSTLEAHEEQLAKRLEDYADKVLGEKLDMEVETKVRFDQVVETVTNPPGSETDQVYPTMTAFKIFYEVTKIQKALNDEAAKAAAPAEDPGADEEDEGGLPKPKPAAPAVDAGGAAASAADKKQIELNTFAADMKAANSAGATIAGSGFDIVTIENFASRLKQYPCFKKVDRQETKKTNNPNRPGWTDFTIKLEVKCDEAPAEKPKVSDKTSEKAGGEKPEGE
ncbi:MAG: pilus assembly protein PilM [Deltaproteobacteria bacterium]|nr:pilus assembly protein PilM [Deltaproteobacteria bacterium]